MAKFKYPSTDHYALAFRHKFIVGYVAEFMYQSDAPLQSAGHRYCRWTARSANLLSRSIRGITRPAGHRPAGNAATTAPAGRATGEEGLFDLLRELGPITVKHLAQRHTGSSEEVASIWKIFLQSTQSFQR
ncbi:hypothetical protein ACLK1S_10410 [Escherichia coli]